MAITDLAQTTTTDASLVTDSTIDSQSIDGVMGGIERKWTFNKWSQHLGYWKETPQLNRSITALAVYTAGLGYTSTQQTLLENITGWGEDSFTSICMDMIKIKKFAGDAFAHIIRNKDTGTLINLKKLDTGRMTIVIAGDGLIDKYEYASSIKGKAFQTFQPNEILHLCNDRIADEVHGTAITDIIEWIILAKKEAMQDWKRISHRSTVRILYIDIGDKKKLDGVKRDYPEALKEGSLLILPIAQKDAKFEDLQLPPVEAFLAWLRYLDNLFYQVVGVPKIIATAEEFTESASKVGFLTFQPFYTTEQHQLESDLWNQVAIRVKFNKPPQLDTGLQQDEAKDGPITATQPNDTIAGRGE